MSFVHDHQLRTLFNEHIPSGVRLDIVDADDLIGIVVVDARVALNLSIQARLSARSDDHCLDIELASDFCLLLLAEMGQANDGETLNLPTLQQLSHHEEGLYGLPHPHVVGNEQTDGLLP